MSLYDLLKNIIKTIEKLMTWFVWEKPRRGQVLALGGMEDDLKTNFKGWVGD